MHFIDHTCITVLAGQSNKVIGHAIRPFSVSQNRNKYGKYFLIIIIPILIVIVKMISYCEVVEIYHEVLNY